MSSHDKKAAGSKQKQKQTFSSRSPPPSGFNIIEPKLNEFKAKMREAEADGAEFKRKSEILWPIIRLTHQRSRYVYQMYLKKVITQAVFDYCSQLNLIDNGLINYWKKPGFEHLCCVACAQHTSQFGSACICRVPANQLSEKAPFECRACGCRGCSGQQKKKVPDSTSEDLSAQAKSSASPAGNEDKTSGNESR